MSRVLVRVSVRRHVLGLGLMCSRDYWILSIYHSFIFGFFFAL
jgi:hypothetical protein